VWVINGRQGAANMKNKAMGTLWKQFVLSGEKTQCVFNPKHAV